MPLHKRLQKGLYAARVQLGLPGAWVLLLLLGAGAVTGCERNPPVVNQVEAAAENFANDIGLTDESENVRVFFALGSSTLQPEAQRKLDAVARRYASVGDPGVTLTGYTDRSGDAAANLALSQRRGVPADLSRSKPGVSAPRA